MSNSLFHSHLFLTSHVGGTKGRKEKAQVSETGEDEKNRCDVMKEQSVLPPQASSEVRSFTKVSKWSFGAALHSCFYFTHNDVCIVSCCSLSLEGVLHNTLLISTLEGKHESKEIHAHGIYLHFLLP